MNKIKLVLRFIKLSWMQAMEYRTNFIIWNLVDISWSIMDLIFFSAIVGYIKLIGDWDLGRALIVIGVFRLMVIFVWGWLFQSLSRLPKLISEGKLDLILSKPVDSQFLVSIQNFSFSILPSLVTGIIFIILGLNLSHIVISLHQFILFIYLTLISAILIYGMYFSSVAIAFFFDRLDNTYNLFNALYDATKYPSMIFPVMLQRIFTFVLPISLIVIVPAEILFKPININIIILFHIVALIFLLLSRFIWSTGLHRYSSASS